MKRKNGFTLIELLAIIVILAVIALITIPKITHMVRYSKEKAVVDSAYGFKNAVNNYYMTELLDAPGLDFNGEYSVIPTSVGAVLRGESEFNVSFSGTAPRGGNIIIDDDDIYGKIQFDDYCVDLSTMVAKKGECSSSLICEYGTESIDYYVLNTVNVTYNEKLIDSCVAIIDDYGFEGDSRAFCKGNYFQGNDIVGLASFESSLAQRLVNAGVLTENDIPEPSTKKHIIEDDNHNKISSLEYYLEDYSASSIGFYSQRYVLNTVSKTLRNQKLYNSCSDYMYDFGFARDQDDVYNLCTDENLINSLVVNNSLDSSQISTLVSSGILTKEGNHEVCSDGITISFNYDDGICDDCYMKVIASGSKVGSLPTVTGNKEFVGWGYGDDQLVTSDTVFYEDTELYAMWLYSKVTFDANGGVCSDCNDMYVIPGAPIGNLPTPTKNGYIFNGWTRDYYNNVNSTTIVDTDFDLHAKWVQAVEKADGAQYITDDIKRYYNPTLATECTQAEYTNNTDKYGLTGCLRWNLYSMKNGYVNMLLDHDISDQYWANQHDYELGLTRQSGSQKFMVGEGEGSIAVYTGVSYPNTVTYFPSFNQGHGTTARGPLTVLKILKDYTNNWNTGVPKVPNKNGNNGAELTPYIIPFGDEDNSYQIDYTGYKARILTYNEIIYLGCLKATIVDGKQVSNAYTCPSWIKSVGNSTEYIWTSTASGYMSAYCVGHRRSIEGCYSKYDAYGIKPVITVDDSIIYSQQ